MTPQSQARPTHVTEISTLLTAYRAGDVTPTDIVRQVYVRNAEYGDDAMWIRLVDEQDALARARELETALPDALPLYGIPFAVKDNIDVAGLPTTAACPAYEYVAERDAPAVRRALDAGAILIGKTNLDQFATGLVGVRSPYGTPRNPFDPDYIPGGSSSGSAVAVAAGLVSFALGTDTAGSGRVPAAFNNIVGLKPSLGRISTRGVVPACRSLDCVSIFALTARDAAEVYACLAGFDAEDAFSRPAPATKNDGGTAGRFGVPRPDQLQFFGVSEGEAVFTEAVARLEALGLEAIEIDFDPFRETAELLYSGPWVAERAAAVGDFIEAHPDDVHPVTRAIVSGAAKFDAVATFRAQYRLRELRRAVEPTLAAVDFIVTPTAGRPYTKDEIAADPVGANTNLGYYTNFMNLLDLCGLAVPTGFYENGLPFGVTLSAPAFDERRLLEIGARLHAASGLRLGAVGPAIARAPESRPWPADQRIEVAVCGAHLSGQPLNGQLTERGARLVHSARTGTDYSMFALTHLSPARPGLVATGDGAPIEVEVWSLPLGEFGGFVALVEEPLHIGPMTLEDGSSVLGFLCAPDVASTAQDITRYGSWRGFMDEQRKSSNT